MTYSRYARLQWFDQVGLGLWLVLIGESSGRSVAFPATLALTWVPLAARKEPMHGLISRCRWLSGHRPDRSRSPHLMLSWLVLSIWPADQTNQSLCLALGIRAPKLDPLYRYQSVYRVLDCRVLSKNRHLPLMTNLALAS